MKTIGLTSQELYNINNYEEYFDKNTELTVKVDTTDLTFNILGIIKNNIPQTCHNNNTYLDVVTKTPITFKNTYLLNKVTNYDKTLYIYHKATSPTYKYRGVNLSAYDNGVLNAQSSYPSPIGICTDGTINSNGTAVANGDTGGWFYTATTTVGAPSRVGNTLNQATTLAYTGSSLHEVVEGRDPPYATSYPLPSQIMAAINAGVNIFRVPFMPQFIPQIATGWAKEGVVKTDMSEIYKPGNCLYFSFYMSTVDFILNYAKTGKQPDGTKNSDYNFKSPPDVKVIIDCHSYMRWAPMNILATSTALDGPPSRYYSMDANTDLRCPYTLNSVAESSNNEYISESNDLTYFNNLFGDPSGWSTTDATKTGSIKWSDISGNPSENSFITTDNITKTFCARATNLPDITAQSDLDNQDYWDNYSADGLSEKPFCNSNNQATNSCYGGPTKTVLGINCFPILWYKLLNTKFHLCDEKSCIPETPPVPTPPPSPTPPPAPSPSCIQTGGTCRGGDTCCGAQGKSNFPCKYSPCAPPTPAPPPAPALGGDMCKTISDNIEKGDNPTLLEYITGDFSQNIWIDLMNEPNQLNTRDLGTAYGKVIKVLRDQGVNNRLLIEGNYWTGMHAQIFPESVEGWQWPDEQPPKYADVKTSLQAYINKPTDTTAKQNYLTAIKHSPVEILYQSISAELNRGPKKFSIGDWYLNLHQYMDANSSGGHGCYGPEQPLITDLSGMKDFTRFDAIEAWSLARDVPLIVTEFGAQLYKATNKDCSFEVEKSKLPVQKSDNNTVCSAGCERKLNLFLQMIETSDRIIGWTIWRATPPVSWSQMDTAASLIGGDDSPIYGWSNGVVWNTSEIKQAASTYQFLQNSAYLSQPLTSLKNTKLATMPLVATGELWALNGTEPGSDFWDYYTDSNKYPTPDSKQTPAPLPGLSKSSSYQSFYKVGYKQ